MESKSPSFSRTIKTEVVCPNDTNPMGLLKGGRLVDWMDIAAAVCAQTHSGKICVTASIHEIDFKAAAEVGGIIEIDASITRAFSTSMEIFVQALVRDVLTTEKKIICEAYFTFVAIDNEGKPSEVCAVKPHTELESKYFKNALDRKNWKTENVY